MVVIDTTAHGAVLTQACFDGWAGRALRDAKGKEERQAGQEGAQALRVRASLVIRAQFNVQSHYRRCHGQNLTMN